MGILRTLIGSLQGPNGDRATKQAEATRANRTCRLEKLENRRVFASLGATNTAVIDFDGVTFGSQEFRLVEPNWELSDFKTDYYDEAHFPSFHSIFRSDRDHLDANGDGETNRDDASDFHRFMDRYEV